MSDVDREDLFDPTISSDMVDPEIWRRTSEHFDNYLDDLIACAPNASGVHAGVVQIIDETLAEGGPKLSRLGRELLGPAFDDVELSSYGSTIN